MTEILYQQLINILNSSNLDDVKVGVEIAHQIGIDLTQLRRKLKPVRMNEINHIHDIDRIWVQSDDYPPKIFRSTPKSEVIYL